MQSVYEQKYNQLVSDNSKLRDTLGQHNMLLDKVNSSDSVGDIEREINQVKYENHQLAGKVEKFNESKYETEKRLEICESKVEKDNNEQLLAEMPDSMAGEYEGLRREKDKLEMELKKILGSVQSLKNERENILNDISADSSKAYVAKLLGELGSLKSRREDLEQELTSTKNPDKEREDLLAHIIQENQELAVLERQIEGAREDLTQLEEESTRIDSDLNTSENEFEYRLTSLKDKFNKIQDFMTSYQNCYDEKIAEVRNINQEIVKLHQQIKADQDKMENLPSERELDKLRREYQSAQENKSEMSIPKLIAENQSLKAELDKLAQMEDSMKEEVWQIQHERREMKNKMLELTDFDKLDQHFASKRRQLHDEGPDARTEKELVDSLKNVETKKNSLESKLSGNPDYKNINYVKTKLESLTEANASLREAIAHKHRREGLEPARKSLSELLVRYNCMLVERYNSM